MESEGVSATGARSTDIAGRTRGFVRAWAAAPKCVAPLRSHPRASPVRDVNSLLDTHASLATSLEMRPHVTPSTLVQSTYFALR